MGGRASKKSKTEALNLVMKVMENSEANALVVRRYANTLRDSCFSDLKWAIQRLKVEEFWEATTSPLSLTYKPTGQKILFRGLDDGFKITSISVPKGVLCFVWIEEAYEITNEDDFNKLDMSIRGEMPKGLYKQITLTFNPWSEASWLKKRFFDYKSDNIYTQVTTFKCNEWLDDADRALFEEMRVTNPRRYAIEGEGHWGIAEGIIYENFEVVPFDIDEVRTLPSVRSAFGLDFGYTNDPTALFCGLVDVGAKTIWVFDEIYKQGMSNENIADEVTRKGYKKEKIIADSAEPKSIARLVTLGLTRVKPARKGKDSINNGIDFIQDFHIIIHPRCVNFIKEINNYVWDKDKKTGEALNKPIDEFNHLMDAMRYAMESINTGTGIHAMRTNW